jgi:cyclophilin family peptidyl-prolyl cis-trans isomerase
MRSWPIFAGLLLLATAAPAVERPEYALTLAPEKDAVTLGSKIRFTVRLEKKRGKPAEVNTLRLAESSVSLTVDTGGKTHRITRTYGSRLRIRLRRGKPLSLDLPVLAIAPGKATFTAVYSGLPKAAEPIRSEPVTVEVTTPEGKSELGAVLVTSEGDLSVRLWPDRAYNTVLNFLTLAEEGRYDGLPFHRVLKDYLVQGGDPKGDGSGGPGYTIPGEMHPEVRHLRGVISMARKRSDPDSAGCQFFIMLAAARVLDGRYAAFGQVVEGMEVADRIAAAKTVIGPDGNDSKPVEPPVLKTVRLVLR